MPPPVFPQKRPGCGKRILSKSAQIIENKRREGRKKPEESSRVRKRMKSIKLLACLREDRSGADDRRFEDLGERIMRGENAEMGLGRVGGI
jgi:replicative DNA helicase